MKNVPCVERNGVIRRDLPPESGIIVVSAKEPIARVVLKNIRMNAHLHITASVFATVGRKLKFINLFNRLFSKIE